MALQCDDAGASVAAYVVYRDIPPGEPFDPTVPPTFFPPKDSDELFDALRAKFPMVKTHSERMRDAIIEFLLEERHVGQYQHASVALSLDAVHATAPAAAASSSAGPAAAAYHSAGSHSHSGSSVLSSPELLNFATPASFDSSPMLPMAQQFPMRQPSISTSSGQPSPPPLFDQMTGVFSLSSGPQPKQRVRRKMTDAEKVEYRKRRIVKACDKCARRKRKCHHNQPEMESVGPPHSTLGHKVAKSFASASSAKSSSTTALPPMSQQQTESFLGHPFVDPAAEQDHPFALADFPLDPAASLFDGHLYPTMDLDDLFYPDIFQGEDGRLAHTNSHARAAPGTMPELRPWASVELPEALDFEGVEPVLPDWPDLDEMGLISGDSGADHMTDDRCIDIRSSSSSGMTGRTAPEMSPMTSGPTAGALASRTRLRTGRMPQSGGETPLERQRGDQDEKPTPTHTRHYHMDLCPSMDTDSSGYSSSTSSDQDALYEALPLDWRHQFPPASRMRSYLPPISSEAAGASRARALSSTSVTVSGGNANIATAQGRPFDASSIITSSQRSDTERRDLQPLSFTTGLLDRVDPAMELFRLRRRIPTSFKGAVARQASSNAELQIAARETINARLAVIPDASAARVPTSLSTETPTPRQENATNLAASAVHTRPRNPAASGFSGNSDQQHAAAPAFGPAAGPLAVSATRLSDHVRYRDHHGRNVQANRLRDYCYVKDHNGRRLQTPRTATALDTLSASATLFVAVAAALFLALGVLENASAMSCLLLAMPFAVLATAAAPFPRRGARWGNEVNCTSANSAWLRLLSAGRRTAKQPAATQNSSAVLRKGPLWLHGLLFPFELAPLCFTC